MCRGSGRGSWWRPVFVLPGCTYAKALATGGGQAVETQKDVQKPRKTMENLEFS